MKLKNFRVSIPENFQLWSWSFILLSCTIAGYRYSKVEQSPGNNTRNLTKRKKICWVNFRVTIPWNFQHPSIVTWSFSTSGHWYPEISLKKQFSMISPRKQKHFQKYFKLWISGLWAIDSWKKPSSKISCYSSFR